MDSWHLHVNIFLLVTSRVRFKPVYLLLNTSRSKTYRLSLMECCEQHYPFLTQSVVRKACLVQLIRRYYQRQALGKAAGSQVWVCNVRYANDQISMIAKTCFAAFSTCSFEPRLGIEHFWNPRLERNNSTHVKRRLRVAPSNFDRDLVFARG